jgi:hypothetical protein
MFSHVSLMRRFLVLIPGMIIGHIAHVDDCKFHNTGKYWRTHDDVKLTADFVAKNEDYKDSLIETETLALI